MGGAYVTALQWGPHPLPLQGSRAEVADDGPPAIYLVVLGCLWSLVACRGLLVLRSVSSRALGSSGWDVLA